MRCHNVAHIPQSTLLESLPCRRNCAPVALPAFAQHYVRTDLTENRKGISSQAKNVDPNLVNAWGLSRSSGSPWWIADNGTGLSTLYDLAGKPQSLVVTIPAPNGASGPSAPTGTVFNYTTSCR